MKLNIYILLVALFDTSGSFARLQGRLTEEKAAVTDFLLVEAGKNASDAVLKFLEDGDVLTEEEYGTSLSIVADTNFQADHYVVFDLNGEERYHFEGKAPPYSLAGDIDGPPFYYIKWNYKCGLQNLTATPYDKYDHQPGIPKSIEFTIECSDLSPIFMWDFSTCGSTDLSHGDEITTCSGPPTPPVTVTTDLGPPRVFDTSSGGPGDLSSCDDDLIVDRGNALIVHEPTSDCVADDNQNGGEITFSFEEPVCIDTIELVDIEEGAIISCVGKEVTVYGEDKGVVKVDNLDCALREGEERVLALLTITVVIIGSGAILLLSGCSDPPPPPKPHFCCNRFTPPRPKFSYQCNKLVAKCPSEDCPPSVWEGCCEGLLGPPAGPPTNPKYPKKCLGKSTINV